MTSKQFLTLAPAARRCYFQQYLSLRAAGQKSAVQTARQCGIVVEDFGGAPPVCKDICANLRQNKGERR